MVKTTARNSGLTWHAGTGFQTKHESLELTEYKIEPLHSTIITHFSKLLMVSWKIPVKSNAADPLDKI